MSVSKLLFLLHGVVLQGCTSFQPSFLLKINRNRNSSSVLLLTSGNVHRISQTQSSRKVTMNMPALASLVGPLAAATEVSKTSNDAPSASSVEPQPPLPLSFVSKPMQLYIEDTDAYGVMYNGNYIKSYERALHDFHTRSRREKHLNRDDIDTGTGTDTGIESCILLDDPNFHLTQCTAHKFKSSPPLGSTYIIRGKLVQMEETHVDGDGGKKEESWSLEMVEHVHDEDIEKNSDSDIHCDRGRSPKVYNTATVTISSSGSQPVSMNPLQLIDQDRIPMLSQPFTVHRDEFDIHMQGSIPISTTLNLFERLRSNSLGGPDRLRQMQEEDNILWVVTSIDDLQIDPNDNIEAGDEVHVQMHCTVKRKGMIIVIDQEILGGGTFDQGESAVLAKGTITLCAIDSKRGRPTSNIPESVKALFQ